MAILKTLTLNGVLYEVTPVVPVASVTVRASAWEGSDRSWHQVVELAGVTPYTKVDLLPTPEQLEIFYNKSLSFVTENDNGVVTVYAIGDKPSNDYTIPVTLTEVKV